MLLQYSIFYKQYGIRRPQQLLSPRVFTLNNMHFSRDALYHFVSHDPLVTDPDINSVFLSGYNKRIIIDFVTELSSLEGHPRKRMTPVLQLVKPFLHENIHYRYTKDAADKIKDPFSLIVINYAYTNKVYKYPNAPMSVYYSWHNTEKTVWDNVISIAKISDREQFFFYDMPDVLPSISMLKVFSNKVNKSMLKVFNTPGKLFLLELWKWLDAENRPLSILAELPSEILSKINIIFTHNSRWISINLNYLNQWRESPETPTVDNVPTFKPLIVQKFFIKSLMQLVSQSQELADDKIDDTLEEDTEGQKPIVDDENTDEEVLENSNGIVVGVAPEAKPKIVGNLLVPEIEDDEVYDFVKNISNDDTLKNIMATLDKELEDLEYIEKQHLLQHDIAIDKHGEEVEVVKPIDVAVVDIYKAKPANEVLKEHLEEYAGFGIMSASDYRNTLKSIEKFNTLKSPYDDTILLKDNIVVTPEHTVILKDMTVLSTTSDIEDKSMHDSTLKIFDKKYITEIMHKDIMGAVANMQNAGIVVEDYSIENDKTILGEFEYHTLKLKPIDGKSSTVRFKLPVINKDSTFLANGNKYIMRKQRVD